MRFHRRWFTVALLVSCLALAASPASAQETVRLTFWTFVDAHADFFLDRAREFNELRPDIDFQLETVVMPFQEMHDQLLIALQTGIGGPDLVDIEIVPFHRYTREPVHLHDLTPIIDQLRQQLQAGVLLQLEVQGGQRRAMLARQGQRLLAVMGHQHLEATAAHGAVQHMTEHLVVVDDQQPFGWG